MENAYDNNAMAESVIILGQANLRSKKTSFLV